MFCASALSFFTQNLFLKILVYPDNLIYYTTAGYFDDLITMNSTHSSCCDNISKVTLLLSKLGFVINPEKYIFNPCQEIECLGFVINSIEMTVPLTSAKKQKILSLCFKLLVAEQALTTQVAQLFGTFSRSFIAVRYGKLYYRSLERCKTKSLVISKGNFDNLMRFQGNNPKYLTVVT